ncbi:transcobalamin-2 [Microcaecilia unicolor]|uniref:Transcobalamin-2 n=1 Tax=Microcaecilia unicolor TaxID=1415580 RepID=A0A6P7ZDS2_9AMPH|nr:transcobalamin-2 [Microcaecilia unicolor]
MGHRWLLCLLSFQVLSVPVQLDDIHGDDALLIQSLTLKLLRSTDDPYKPLNPSVHLGLRLSREHNLEKEAQYLQKLREVFQPTLGSSTHSDQEEPSTGLLALYILALRASCEDFNTHPNRRLISQLKHLLHEEKQHIGLKGFPISNFYQYSLGVLSLCLTQKVIDHHVIEKLVHAQEEDKFSHNQHTSVDTEAVAGLAFLCLQHSNLYPAFLMEKLRNATIAVKEKLVQNQTPGEPDILGNIYSTSLALQFLWALEPNDNEAERSKFISILLNGVKKEHFKNPMPISQLLPVLHHKNYLDIAKLNCKDEQETPSLDWVPGSRGSKVNVLEDDEIFVWLSVKVGTGSSMEYSKLLYVRSGSSLLDVLRTAQKDKSQDFTFETKVTLSGKMLTAVKGIEASGTERTYWQLIKAPDTPLLEGIEDYIPKKNEHIILRLAKW